MTDTQLTQMALSAVKRCKEQVDIFVLIDILCGKKSRIIEQNGFDQIKTYGVGKAFLSRQWHYFIIQMLLQDLFVINYDDNCFLKITEKGEDVVKGNLEVQLIRPQSVGLHFVRQGYQVTIDGDIQDAIDWREITNKIGNMAYWNYQEEKRINLKDIIPDTVDNREQVVAKFQEIMEQAFHVSCDETCLVIPKKVDLDMYGKEVASLQLPFEECLNRFRQFVLSTQRYPKMNSLAEEVALRKWFREVGHGIAPVTSEQMEKFKKLTEEFPLAQYNK